MSKEHDLTYFLARAETERALAAKSATPQIAAIHIAMAECYEALASGGLLSPPLSL